MRRTIADGLLVFAPDHRDHADAPGFFVAMLSKGDGMQALFATSPAEFGKFGGASEQPCWLAREMAVEPLFNMAGEQPAQPITGPAATLGWARQIECFPGVTVCWMLKHAAPTDYCGQCGFEASAVVAQLILVRFPGAAVPESSPSLAGWMRDHRPRSVVVACIALTVPRIDVIEPVVDAASFDEESGDHSAPAPNIAMTLAMPSRMANPIPRATMMAVIVRVRMRVMRAELA